MSVQVFKNLHRMLELMGIEGLPCVSKFLKRNVFVEQMPVDVPLSVYTFQVGNKTEVLHLPTIPALVRILFPNPLFAQHLIRYPRAVAHDAPIRHVMEAERVRDSPMFSTPMAQVPGQDGQPHVTVFAHDFVRTHHGDAPFAKVKSLYFQREDPIDQDAPIDRQRGSAHRNRTCCRPRRCRWPAAGRIVAHLVYNGDDVTLSITSVTHYVPHDQVRIAAVAVLPNANILGPLRAHQGAPAGQVAVGNLPDWRRLEVDVIVNT
ncbi:hypothetical protein BCR44DRAFT_1441190 [Catenaria anguillulae PL171]|uniref:Uncharacterized protein n=1 Tax=Catenaria anguillulae PL171 TaxID=765915 RepID=A0A1Y2HBN2_9FUNG|nr:hypothetical protein BCR44DRAFT_1441190 [Catenaria anguillulae PL171]